MFCSRHTFMGQGSRVRCSHVSSHTDDSPSVVLLFRLLKHVVLPLVLLLAHILPPLPTKHISVTADKHKHCDHSTDAIFAKLQIGRFDVYACKMNGT